MKGDLVSHPAPTIWAVGAMETWLQCRVYVIVWMCVCVRKQKCGTTIAKTTPCTEYTHKHREGILQPASLRLIARNVAWMEGKKEKGWQETGSLIHWLFYDCPVIAFVTFCWWSVLQYINCACFELWARLFVAACFSWLEFKAFGVSIKNKAFLRIANLLCFL